MLRHLLTLEIPLQDGWGRCDDSGTPEKHPPIWCAIPPSSWDFNAGTVSPGSSRQLSRIHGLSSNGTLHQDSPGKSALQPCSLSSVPFSLAISTLPTASPTPRANNNLFFLLATCLLSFLKKQIPGVSNIAINQMLMHPHLPLRVNKWTTDSPSPCHPMPEEVDRLEPAPIYPRRLGCSTGSSTSAPSPPNPVPREAGQAVAPPSELLKRRPTGLQLWSIDHPRGFSPPFP